MSVLSVRIRQRREELGMSQEELAARMGLPLQVLHHQDRKGGQRYPSEQDRGLCRRALHTTAAWLLGLEEERVAAPSGL